MSEQSDDHDHEQMHDFGRPNILKLANRFESYVDIENKVQMHHNNKRSSLSLTDANFNPSGASDAGSTTTTETHDTDGAVSGIMV